MPEHGEHDVTRLIARWRDGDDDARELLMQRVYANVRSIAAQSLRRMPNATLSATDIAHEALIRLLGADANWENRKHFFHVAAQATRQVLVDSARKRLSDKRGGGAEHIDLDEALGLSGPHNSTDLLRIDHALQELSVADARRAQTIELVYFGGLSRAEVARTLRLRGNRRSRSAPRARVAENGSRGMSASLDRFADHFERLRGLPDPQRSYELDRLALDAGERDRLRRMLEADALADDPLRRAIIDAAAGLHARDSERLGPWRLLREIGAGGMARCFWRARRWQFLATGRDQCCCAGFPTDDGMRRLRQERQILAGLTHPNIARLLDGGETADGQPWLAIEYVAGIGLLEHISAHAHALAQRLALFDDMLAAVEHAHQRLVIHRDIKPGNVLVTPDGDVKLLDFGIARLVDNSADSRETSTRVYSSGYASPEQIEGRAITRRPISTASAFCCAKCSRAR